MKKAIKKLVAVVILLTVSVTIVKAGKGKGDTNDFVVRGVIAKSNNEHSKFKIELFYENRKVDSSIVNPEESFDVKLKKNVWYTIRISTEGFVSQMISFNTELKNGVKVKNNKFEFTTELISNADAELLNKELLEFPISVVSVDKTTRKFQARESYTNSYLHNLNMKVIF